MSYQSYPFPNLFSPFYHIRSRRGTSTFQIDKYMRSKHLKKWKYVLEISATCNQLIVKHYSSEKRINAI